MIHRVCVIRNCLLQVKILQKGISSEKKIKLNVIFGDFLLFHFNIFKDFFKKMINMMYSG
jgi:hypothetical protein